MKRERVFLIVQGVGVCAQESVHHLLLKLLKEVPSPHCGQGTDFKGTLR